MRSSQTGKLVLTPIDEMQSRDVGRFVHIRKYSHCTNGAAALANDGAFFFDKRTSDRQHM